MIILSNVNILDYLFIYVLGTSLLRNQNAYLISHKSLDHTSYCSRDIPILSDGTIDLDGITYSQMRSSH